MIRYEEYAFQVSAKPFVHQRHFKFVLKVRPSAQSPYKGAGVYFLREVHGQPSVGTDLHVSYARDRLLEQVYSLFSCEEQSLGRG